MAVLAELKLPEICAHIKGLPTTVKMRSETSSPPYQQKETYLQQNMDCLGL